MSLALFGTRVEIESDGDGVADGLVAGAGVGAAATGGDTRGAEVSAIHARGIAMCRPWPSACENEATATTRPNTSRSGSPARFGTTGIVESITLPFRSVINRLTQA